MVGEVDLDASGTIGFEEFVTMMTSTSTTQDALHRDIIAAFAKFDSDDCGYISPKQLGEVVTNLGERLSEDEIQAVVARCSDKGWTDADGRISYNNFVLNELVL